MKLLPLNNSMETARYQTKEKAVNVKRAPENVSHESESN